MVDAETRAILERIAESMKRFEELVEVYIRTQMRETDFLHFQSVTRAARKDGEK